MLSPAASGVIFSITGKHFFFLTKTEIHYVNWKAVEMTCGIPQSSDNVCVVMPVMVQNHDSIKILKKYSTQYLDFGQDTILV